jgi:hypothetical protein
MTYLQETSQYLDAAFSAKEDQANDLDAFWFDEFLDTKVLGKTWLSVRYGEPKFAIVISSVVRKRNDESAQYHEDQNGYDPSTP